MPVVHLSATLRALCGGAQRVVVPAGTLDAVLRALDERCPGVYERLVAGHALRPEVAVAIDGEVVQLPLDEPIAPDAEVAIVPAIAGGGEPLTPPCRPRSAPASRRPSAERGAGLPPA